jgi:hypothetical protein
MQKTLVKKRMRGKGKISKKVKHFYKLRLTKRIFWWMQLREEN